MVRIVNGGKCLFFVFVFVFHWPSNKVKVARVIKLIFDIADPSSMQYAGCMSCAHLNYVYGLTCQRVLSVIARFGLETSSGHPSGHPLGLSDN